MLLGISHGLAALHDWQVGVDVGVANGTDEGEAGVEAPLVQVIEKQAANATRFVAVLDMEVAVAPGLVTRVDVGAKRRTRSFGHAVPVDAVFFVAVVGGEVEAAAEPPHRFFTFFFRDEKAHIGVGRWHMRIVRVNHQRHTERFKPATGQLRAMGAG